MVTNTFPNHTKIDIELWKVCFNNQSLLGEDYLSIQAHDKIYNLITKHDITFSVTASSSGIRLNGMSFLVLLSSDLLLFFVNKKR